MPKKKYSDELKLEIVEEYLKENIYLSPILDMYNGEIISYNISEKPVLNQVLKMLNYAFEKYRIIQV